MHHRSVPEFVTSLQSGLATFTFFGEDATT